MGTSTIYNGTVSTRLSDRASKSTSFYGVRSLSRTLPRVIGIQLADFTVGGVCVVGCPSNWSVARSSAGSSLHSTTFLRTPYYPFVLRNPVSEVPLLCRSSTSCSPSLPPRIFETPSTYQGSSYSQRLVNELYARLWLTHFILALCK